jgi:hypothetical protein
MPPASSDRGRRRAGRRKAKPTYIQRQSMHVAGIVDDCTRTARDNGSIADEPSKSDRGARQFDPSKSGEIRRSIDDAAMT